MGSRSGQRPGTVLAERGAPGGGSSNDPAAERAAIAARYADRPPFSQTQFEQTTLTPLTGQGGHMAVSTLNVNGREYVAKAVEAGDTYERYEHDLAARGIAKALGLGDVTLPQYHYARNGVDYIVAPYVTGKSLEKVSKEDKMSAVDAFRLMSDATRKDIAVYSYFVGDHDRIKPNFYAERAPSGAPGAAGRPYSKVYAIDYTRAFGTATHYGLEGAEGQLLKFGIGGGAKAPWRTVALPLGLIARMGAQSREMQAIARHYIEPHASGVSRTELGIRARLGILERAVERGRQAGRAPTFGDLADEARSYPTQLWQEYL